MKIPNLGLEFVAIKIPETNTKCPFLAREPKSEKFRIY
jgi:hypothetical protein